MAGETRKRLGELLLEAGVIDAAQLQAALGHQRQWGARLGQALVDLKLAAEPDIVQALSRKYGYQVARLDTLQPYALQQALRLVPRDFAVRHNVLPMAADPGAITVAMSDPTNLAVVDELGFRTGRRVKICVGGDREIAAAVRQHYPAEGGGLEAIALDLEADEAPGEPVLDPFGGGSKDALEAFFGSGPALRPPLPAGGPVAPSRPPVQGAPPPMPPGSRPPPATVRPPSPPPGLARSGAPVAAGPGAARSAASGPETAPAVGAQRGPGLELEDVHGPEAMEHARAAFLGAIPAGGLADADEPLHRQATRPPPPPVAAGASAQPASAVAPPGSVAPGGAGPQPSAQLTARERAILDALDRLAGGAHAEPELLKPAQAMAAVIKILIRRGIVSERELLDELRRR